MSRRVIHCACSWLSSSQIRRRQREWVCSLHGRNCRKLKSVLHMLPVCVFMPVERQLDFDFFWMVCAGDICQCLQGQVLCCTCYQMLGSIHDTWSRLRQCTFFFPANRVPRLRSCMKLHLNFINHQLSRHHSREVKTLWSSYLYLHSSTLLCQGCLVWGYPFLLDTCDKHELQKFSCVQLKEVFLNKTLSTPSLSTLVDQKRCLSTESTVVWYLLTLSSPGLRKRFRISW
jgi:hypothetical protein